MADPTPTTRWRFFVSWWLVREFIHLIFILVFYFICFFLPYRSFIYILWLLALCFYEIPVYVKVCVSVPIHVSCVFSLFLLLSVLSYSDLFVSLLFNLIIVLQMPICFLKRNWKGWIRMWRELGKISDELEEEIYSEYIVWKI